VLREMIFLFKNVADRFNCNVFVETNCLKVKIKQHLLWLTTIATLFFVIYTL